MKNNILEWHISSAKLELLDALEEGFIDYDGDMEDAIYCCAEANVPENVSEVLEIFDQDHTLIWKELDLDANCVYQAMTQVLFNHIYQEVLAYANELVAFAYGT